MWKQLEIVLSVEQGIGLYVEGRILAVAGCRKDASEAESGPREGKWWLKIPVAS